MTEAEIHAGMLSTAVADMKRLIAAGDKALPEERPAADRIAQLMIFGHLDGVIMMSERLAAANRNNGSGKMWAKNADVYRGIGRVVEAIPVARAGPGLAALIEDLERNIEALTKHKPVKPGDLDAARIVLGATKGPVDA